MVKIVVGSKNPAKIEAVREVLAEYELFTGILVAIANVFGRSFCIPYTQEVKTPKAEYIL